MNRGEELTLAIGEYALDGKCVARVEGFVVFVRGAIPGDTARVRVVRAKKNYADAELVELLNPSPHRVRPPCRYFGTCGGCRWQHVDYAQQLAFKRRHVIDALERVGGLAGLDVHPTLASDATYCYRNKMEFSFGERWLTEEERLDPDADRFALGLHIPQRFDRVIDLQECHLQSEMSVRIVNAVREFCRLRSLTVYATRTHTGYLRNLVIREGRRTGQVMVNLVTSEDRPALMEEFTRFLLGSFPQITTVCNNITQRKSQVALGDVERVCHGPGYIVEKIGENSYHISANSFFQTNTEQAERLYDAAVRLAALTREDTVLDLYSGTGTIALHMARQVRHVIGIEAVEAAVRDAERNARVNGADNCTFVSGDVKEKLTRDTAWMGPHPAPSVVVVDPPRAGAHEKVMRRLAHMRPSRIVYVSCNPATQARDLALLCTTAPYVVAQVQPVDMFPHTSHVENLVSLRLREE